MQWIFLRLKSKTADYLAIIPNIESVPKALLSLFHRVLFRSPVAQPPAATGLS
jgi:hypothetical protein